MTDPENPTERRRPGRPRSNAEPRHYVGFICPASLRQRLAAAAADNRASLSEEVKQRLERSFRDDEIMARLDEITARLDGTALPTPPRGRPRRPV
jgi:hypothetical protein